MFQAIKGSSPVVLATRMLIAAWKTLGKSGTFIVVIFFAALVYLSLQEGWGSSGSRESLEWLALILYSAFLGIGLSGAIIWRRATGQVITDEADDLNHWISSSGLTRVFTAIWQHAVPILPLA